jgi:DMSO/TMAO reductase YedYZ molybdopterin-dependent catalytic subunit
MTAPISRRSALELGAGGLIASTTPRWTVAAKRPPDPADTSPPPPPPPRPFLTPGEDFRDVSRGKPLPHTLEGQALVKACLTPEAWRLEIHASDKAEIQKPHSVERGSALDYPSLLELGQTRGVRFLKAMQCNNIPLPLGQGLWEGVPLRDVLSLCGTIKEARRLYYWGFHNNDAAQIFQSSLAMNQVLDTPPGDLPPFVAYRLNGGPIPLERGGPVRMVVPWAHGFKSVKWLQHIVITNEYAANDTYALAGNDPESYLKTAAYFDDSEPQDFKTGAPVLLRGTAMVGWPGLDRIEYSIGPAESDQPAEHAWKACAIDPPPPPTDWGGGLPGGLLLSQVWGFTSEGKPREWPLRYSIAHWTLELPRLDPGSYDIRVRTVDRNGHAQPQPRPSQRSGRNLIQVKRITIS